MPRIVPLQERAASLTGRLCSAITVNCARGVPVTGKAASLCTPVAQFPARGVNEDNCELRARRASQSRGLFLPAAGTCSLNFRGIYEPPGPAPVTRRETREQSRQQTTEYHQTPSVLELPTNQNRESGAGSAPRQIALRRAPPRQKGLWPAFSVLLRGPSPDAEIAAPATTVPTIQGFK